MAEIFFEVRGEGHPVILLHGFPMNHQVWENFSLALSKHHRVFIPDLPGFGKSPRPSDRFTLEDIAKELIGWIREEKIPHPVIVGHSLGGYVALAMVEKDASLFSGLGLFHSTALADSEERKASRTKVIEFVERNGVEAFTVNFIEPLFADNNNPAIASVKEIARQTSAETVIAYTLAMRDRKNREETIAKFSKPIFFLGGEKDQGISPESLKIQATKSQHSELHILSDSAHMAMFEQPAKALTLVHDFVDRCRR